MFNPNLPIKERMELFGEQKRRAIEIILATNDIEKAAYQTGFSDEHLWDWIVNDKEYLAAQAALFSPKPKAKRDNPFYCTPPAMPLCGGQ